MVLGHPPAALLLCLCLCASDVALAEGPHARKPALIASRKPARDVKSWAAQRRAQKLGLGTRKAAGALLRATPEPSWIRAAGGTSLPGTLRFPVARGWFGRGFGSGEGNYHQAMDIGGDIGATVRAAASGIVGYAGDELSGYGNIVMLIHPGGWVTTYAHNTKNLVVAGQLVERGAAIATLGSTGRSSGPHVHFELLFRGENCDPAPLFRPFAKHKNGKSLHGPGATWRDPKKRPKTVVCQPRRHHPAYAKKPSEQTSEDVALDEDDEVGSTTTLDDAKPAE